MARNGKYMARNGKYMARNVRRNIKSKSIVKCLLPYFIISIITFILVVAYLAYRIKVIDSKIKQYPVWIDKSLSPILEKKANIPFVYKITELVFVRGKYMEWQTMEKYLDILIEKTKATNIQFDAIVGIKSGGAILSNYIAKKMNIMNYYVRSTRDINTCNSTDPKSINENIDRFIGTDIKYKICEGIDDNLENKNIILIDENVGSGKTMEFICNYLLTEKKINKIFLLTIVSECCSIVINNNKLNCITDYDFTFIFPWGYDN